MKIHIVQKGDTLWKIAKKYGVNFEELKKLNTQLSNPDMIMPGMKIKVPGPGGSIKKEAPIGGVPDAKIKMGAKKEMPITEHPFAKEKPITLPVTEAPKGVPVKEAPKKEAPIVAPPKKELPKAPVAELPKVTAPQVEIPKEVPVKPYIPKMPKPIMPEIEINKYYFQQPAPKQLPKQLPKEIPYLQPQIPPKQLPKEISMQQPVSVQPPKQLPKQIPIQQPVSVQPPKQLPKQIPIQQPVSVQPPKQLPKQMPQFPPQLPPKPVNILPQAKPIAMESPGSIESESIYHTHQGGFYQPMYPYHPSCFYPVSPVMPGSGFHGGYPSQQMPYPQVHGAATMPMHQMPLMPSYGVAGVESPAYMESSSYMPMYHHQFPHHVQTLPAEAGMQAPAPVMGVAEHQLPLQPTYTAPAMQPAYGHPCPPYPTHMIPVSPIMPGSGFCEPMPYGHMPYGYPQMGAMPLVQGVMEESPGMAQMPIMPSYSQMPVMPAEAQKPLMPVKGAESDCGCGGGVPQMYPGAYGPGYRTPGMYDMGLTPQYGVPYGQPQVPYGQPQAPYMNPYGSPYGYDPMDDHAFEMPRSIEESSEYGD